MKPSAFASVAALILTLMTQAVPAAVSVSGVDSIFSSFDKPGTPGCAVGVFEKGRPLLMRGYGVADVTSGAKLDDATLFYAASTSKQFTALSIALLAARGKLKLEDDVRKYIPELPDYGSPLRISMLVHHTSGLGDYLGLFDMAGTEHYEKLDPASVLAMIVRQTGVQFEPGTDYRYSNTGYFLLAHTVERVSGQSFPQFVHDHILAPLGMRDSYMRNGADNPPKSRVAHGYVQNGQAFEVRNTYPAFGGSGGLMTSVRDLQKFDRDFQVGHKVWNDAVRRIMLTPGTFNDGQPVAVGDGLDYAGGLQVGRMRGLYWVSHGGAAAAFRSEYVRLPELNIGVAVLCNRGDATPGKYVEQVIDSMGLAQLTGEWPEEKRRNRRSEEGDAEAFTPAMIAALQGKFRSEELAAEYSFVSSSAGALQVKVTSAYSGNEPYQPLGAVRMRSREQLVTDEGYVLQLERAPNGRIEGFSLNGADMRSLRFTRVP